MHTGVIWPRGVNIGNRPLIEANMKGCQVREWIVGEKHMSFSRILYMMWEIKETLQWPPMETQLVVYTQPVLLRWKIGVNDNYRYFVRRLGP